MRCIYGSNNGNNAIASSLDVREARDLLLINVRCGSCLPL